MSTSILLSGPPGVGKSSIGRAVAARLGTVAVDLDDAVLAETKRTPAAIIRAEGEAAFRDVEARTLESLDPSHRVVALGGGTLTTPRGRKAARARGAVLGLTADVETLRARIALGGVDRPLLGEAAAALGALLEARRTSYAAVDLEIDTRAAIDLVAERVAERTERLELIFSDVGPARTRILVGEHLARAAAGAIAALTPSRPVLIVADRGVPETLRAEYVAAVSALFRVHTVAVAGGEDVKSWSALGELLEEAVGAGCGRQSVVLAIGGGATCDLAALAASLLGRGAPVVLVPSTLLAQVDASIGGKCAVNLRAGKNLAGAFHPASDVIADTALLASLDARRYRSGLAELLKIGIISDGPLFGEIVRAHPSPATISHIARAIRAKADIVARDPFERSERKLLNLGHTLGHALEAASEMTLEHGEAVAIGIAAAARFSASRGWLAQEALAKITGGLEHVGLPTTAAPELLSSASSFLAHDKKADDAGLDLIAVHELGKVSTKRVSSSDLVDLVRYGGKA